MTGTERTNWAGNLAFAAIRFHEPESVDELRRIVAASSHVRALGTGHSFNTIADTPGDQISLARLPPSVELDRENGTVTVAAGLRYAEVTSRINAEGFALHNLGSLPHISVAGACSTGTHGSGDGNGNLSTAVTAVEIVNAEGDLVTVSAGDPAFPGVMPSLGALGVVTRVTLRVEPAYDMRQWVYEGFPITSLDSFEEIMKKAYSVSIFTDWREGLANQVWVKERLDAGAPTPPAEWVGGALAKQARHPVPGVDAINCTTQLGVPGPWHERLPHFRHDVMPSAGDELQSEYVLPREHAVAAMHAILAIRHVITPVLLISEVRTVAADDRWLSPSFERDSVCLHFTLVRDPEAVAPVITAIEAALAPFDARPHWGKVFSTDPELVRASYPRFGDFQQLAGEWDPSGKFRNDLIGRYLGLPA